MALNLTSCPIDDDSGVLLVFVAASSSGVGLENVVTSSSKSSNSNSYLQPFTTKYHLMTLTSAQHRSFATNLWQCGGLMRVVVLYAKCLHG